MKKFTDVKELVASLEADVDKFYNKGNRAAGTRLRKGMLKLKHLAQHVRIDILAGGGPNNGGPGRGPNNGGPGHKPKQPEQNI
jgi:hypothetical protein